MRSFRRIVMLLVVGVLVGVYAGSGISPAGAGDNGRDTVARGEMPVLESGTVVYHETLTKLGALLAAPSVSSNSAFPLDLSAFDYRTETWLLLGEQGKIVKQYYRKVSPKGTVLEEDFRDATAGIEYNYFPVTRWFSKSPWPGEVVGRATPEALAAAGYQLAGRAAVAGFPGLVFERHIPLAPGPAWSPLCLVPGYYFRLEGPPAPQDRSPATPAKCPKPSDFEPTTMVDRSIVSEAPVGIHLGSDDVYVDKRGRQALMSGTRLTRQEIVPASSAPAQLLQWKPPPGARELGSQGGPGTPTTLKLDRGDNGILARYCNDYQDYPYSGWWIWWAACIDNPYPYNYILGYASQGGEAPTGSFDYLYVWLSFRAKNYWCQWRDWLYGSSEVYNATFVEASTLPYGVYQCGANFAQTSSWHYWRDQGTTTEKDGYIQI